MITARHESLRLASSEARAAQARVHERLHAGNFLMSGYHFCVVCQHITELLEPSGYRTCCFCGSSQVKFCPPVSPEVRDQRTEINLTSDLRPPTSAL